MPRAEILKTIAAKTGLRQAQVSRVFEELSVLVKDYLDVEGAGEFLIPKLGIKIKKIRRKPTKSRSTVSPITESKVVIPSKPARWDIKVLALKKLKEIISQEKLP